MLIHPTPERNASAIQYGSFTGILACCRAAMFAPCKWVYLANASMRTTFRVVRAMLIDAGNAADISPRCAVRLHQSLANAQRNAKNALLSNLSNGPTMTPERQAQAKALLALEMALSMLKTIERGGNFDATEYRANVATIQTARDSFAFFLRQRAAA